MAIIFISPKKKQRTFFIIITVILALALFTIGVMALLPEFNRRLAKTDNGYVISIPEVMINFNLLDSERVKAMASFQPLLLEYRYVAANSALQKQEGVIFASSQEEAESLLKQQGLKVELLEEKNVGRSEPFVSY